MPDGVRRPPSRACTGFAAIALILFIGIWIGIDRTFPPATAGLSTQAPSWVVAVDRIHPLERLPSQQLTSGVRAKDPEQQATASSTAASSPSVTATLVGQASRRLSMPLSYRPATAPLDPPTPTPWPKSPVEQLTESVTTVAAGGGYAYLGTGQELIVVDVHDPTRPAVVGRVRLGWPDTVEAVDIIRLETRVIVLGMDRNVLPDDPRDGSYLATIDIRVPSGPRVRQLLGQREFAFAMDRIGDTVVVPAFRRGRSCGGADTGLVILDAGKESGLTRTACHPMVDIFPMAIAAERTDAIVAGMPLPDESGAAVVWMDLVDPLRPVVRRSERTQMLGLPRAIAHQQGMTAVAALNSDAVWFGNAEAVADPLLIAHVGDGRNCGVDGLTAFDGDWFLRMGHGCSQPSLIRWSGQIAAPTERGETEHMAIIGRVDLQPAERHGRGNTMVAAEGLIFLVDTQYGGILTIIDIRVTDAPRVVGRLD